MIPRINPGIISSVKQEINEFWIINTLERVKDYDPVMGALIAEIGKRLGIDALGKALLVYRMIESQIEADDMGKQFSD